MPRKNKTNRTEKSHEGANSISSLNGEKKKRHANGKKPAGRKSRHSTRKPKMIVGSVPSSATEPSDEMVRMCAYFIAERRHRLGLPGDAGSDWLEAKRQLLSDLGPR